MSSDAGLAVRLDRVSKRYRAGRSRTVVDLIGSRIDRLRGRGAAVHSATSSSDV